MSESELCICSHPKSEHRAYIGAPGSCLGGGDLGWCDCREYMTEAYASEIDKIKARLDRIERELNLN